MTIYCGGIDVTNIYQDIVEIKQRSGAIERETRRIGEVCIFGPPGFV